MLELSVEFERPVLRDGEGPESKYWRVGDIYDLERGVRLAHDSARAACRTGVPFKLCLFSVCSPCLVMSRGEPLRYKLEFLSMRSADHADPRKGYYMETFLKLAEHGVPNDVYPYPGGVHLFALKEAA